MQNLISAILAFLAALAVTVSPVPQEVVVQSTPTPMSAALPNCYNDSDPNCWDEFYRLYQNCPQQLADASGGIHPNGDNDLEYIELCKQWEYEHNPIATPLPTETPQPTPALAPTEPRLPRGPTNTPAP